MTSNSRYKYGIVIDSGSSGSRIQIYQWDDPVYLKDDPKSKENPSLLKSPPKIIQDKDWTLKISPGISTYTKKVNKIWSQHYSKLIKFAQDIIPPESHPETPIFVLSTAGMRMVTPSQRKAILKETCSSIQKNTKFMVSNCKDFVQTIDGETEGIYGWLGLNYLMGQFDNYDPKEHSSIGFMDMGGASTQIAFVPSSEEEIKKHKEDLSAVSLRNLNGEIQEWNVFVETWLEFGANEARKRYLNQLVNLAITNTKKFSDPCLPKNAEIQYEYKGESYTMKGTGDHAMCLRMIYPLLLKNVPCKEEPCLFNGIHGPKLNFEKDRFVGISEYWYTANDIFQSGGEYNFHTFNEKVKEYCESDWSSILENSKQGQYSNLDPEKFLKDACFKASWVLNILHEGFELPRLGIDILDDVEVDKEEQKIDKIHVPFKSANSVDGEELSWTLGKILLFASAQIESSDSREIGIYPAELSGKKFIPAGTIKPNYDSDDDEDDDHIIYSLIFFILLFIMIYHFGRTHIGKLFYKTKRLQIPVLVKNMAMKIPGMNKVMQVSSHYVDMNSSNDLISLEEGFMVRPNPDVPSNNSVLRTRLNINLADDDDSYFNDQQASPNAGVRTYNSFVNKPFMVPKKNSQTTFFQFENSSRDLLNRIPTPLPKQNTD